MLKVCTDCKLEKSLEEFYTYTRKDRGEPRTLTFAHCKKCNALRSKQWKKDNPEKNKAFEKKHNDATKDLKKDWRLQKEYAISLDQFNQLLEEQKRLCKICLTKPATDVDHCHVTKKVRGLLCNNCNRGLGFFQDNPLLLQNAISYLS